MSSKTITFNYDPPLDLFKQSIDFFIWSLLYQYPSNSDSPYGKIVNKELETILDESLRKIISAQKRCLTMILCIKIVLESRSFAHVASLLDAQEIDFMNQQSVMKAGKIILDSVSSIDDIISAGEAEQGEMRDMSKMLKILDNAKLMIDKIFAIEKIQNNLNDYMDDSRKSRSWNDILELKKKNVWQIMRYSSIPQRIVGYMMRFKGIGPRENLTNSFTINTRILRTFKEKSKQFLIGYFSKNKSLIARSIIKSFPNLLPEQTKNIIDFDSIEAICHDLVYSNKMIPNIENKKKSSSINHQETSPFDPFRFYEYMPRKQFAVRLNDQSRYERILEDYMERSEIPFSIFIDINHSFNQNLQEFIDENDLVIPDEEKIHDFENFEIDNPQL